MNEENKKNQLNNAEMYKLCSHIEQNFNLYENKKYHVVASEATLAMGFLVTESNIQSVKKTTGLELGSKNRINKRTICDVDRDIELLANAIHEIREFHEDVKWNFDISHLINLK